MNDKGEIDKLTADKIAAKLLPNDKDVGIVKHDVIVSKISADGKDIDGLTADKIRTKLTKYEEVDGETANRIEAEILANNIKSGLIK
ncbi:MAG: hypothetical protein PHV23_03450 [Candidatus Gracilibacteria bacterium]|nr:hypothetical protein [Candidatus Gracilibacteria bacterium]